MVPDPLADNPDNLDSRAEIAAEIESRGHDPMDIDSNDRLTFGWALLHNGEPGERLDDRSEETVALGAERLISAAHDRDVELSDPVDVAEEQVPDRYEDGWLIK